MDIAIVPRLMKPISVVYVMYCYAKEHVKMEKKSDFGCTPKQRTNFDLLAEIA